MNRDELEKESGRLLDEHADALDASTLSKLHQARNAAVEGAGTSKLHVPMPWIAAGAAASGLLVAVLFMDRQTPAPLPAIYSDPVQPAAAEEMELLDDLEFMAWLVLEDEFAGEQGENT